MGDANSTASTRRASASRVNQRTPSLRRMKKNMSSLRVVNVSPQQDRRSWHHVQQHQHDDLLDSPFSTPGEETAPRTLDTSGPEHMSLKASATPPSVFDIAEEPLDDRYTEPTTALASSGRESDDIDSYNLKPPPPPLIPQKSLEVLATRFFSVDHLDEILCDYSLALRFTRFLSQYRPQHSDTLKQYAEARKAIAAVEYANAIASQIESPPGHPPFVAASLDDRFEARTRRIMEDLVEEALPAYLTHRLVFLVTDTLVKEITGNAVPIMHDLIPSLAEVYCISDPSMPDNPIVYASEEFCNISQYSREFAIGRNCRFLQGPKSSMTSVRRLVQALKKGEETTETILNYKRDGTAFMNLLMIAPLFDNKGTVRYFLGCQIDVSSLIEGGRGLESFASLLSKDRSTGRYSGPIVRDPKQVLGDLGQLLTEDEADVVKNRTRRMSFVSQRQPSLRSSTATRPTINRRRSSRVILGMEDTWREPPLWPQASLGPSGRLPGVYQNFLLVRPYPSLRITFTSPALRIPGLLQTKLLDRVGGPSTVREGLLEALSSGTGVTAKVTWLTSGSEMDGGKPRWLHCTPLFGSDDRVGVWMVVMVENETVTGSLNRHGIGNGSSGRSTGANRYTSSKLYADYLKREGRPLTGDTQQTTSSIRERRETDDHFRDF